MYTAERALDDALLEHGGGDLHEAGDVGALHVVDGAVGLGAVLHASLVDGVHDEVQLLIDLLAAPADVGRVLGHFQAGSRDAAGVDRLAGREIHPNVLEERDGAGLAAHIGHLAAAPAAVLLELLGIGERKLVLEGAGESDVHGNAPGLLAGGEHGLVRELGGHILNH